MNSIARRTPIYGLAACVAILGGAACNGGGSGAGSTVGLPAGVTQSSLKSLLKPATGTITEYSIPRREHRFPKTFPIGISPGPDGTMWFAERGLGRLGRITTDGTFLSPCKLRGQARFPQNVTMGPDGNLWAVTGSTRTYNQESNGVPDPYGAVVMVTPACVQKRVGTFRCSAILGISGRCPMETFGLPRRAGSLGD